MQTDPFERFEQAIERASGNEPFDATRAALATADAAGRPSVRFVLVKEHGPDGFVFYTNYESRKAREIEENGFGALAWHWFSTGEQVRAEGSIARVSDARSDAYFATRDRASRIGAWASPQSRTIVAREELVARVHEIEQRFGDGEVPRPPYWGGFVLRPERIEFWKNGESRLHDRWLYRREGDRWRIERLAP
jgi:pyridoxamine 5'-phosphate oxidase